MGRLRILTAIALVLAIVVFVIKNRQPSTFAKGDGMLINRSWLTANVHSETPVKDVRPPDQTFLTYPEWFLVFSPAEQASYFKTNTSTTFPYLKHVDQLWKGYDVMYHQVNNNYPFNTGYHVMIMVIAGSTTVEYSTKSFYETIVGRVTDPAVGAPLTEEDKFNAAYMYSYVNFIEDLPWYEYNFNHQLERLWSSTSFFGPYFLRKLERKYYLTTELAVKSSYGWLIKLATKSAYDEALLNTAVIVNKIPTDLKTHPEITNIRKLDDGNILMDLPRYAKFNPAVTNLAKGGLDFKEIAGNNSAIMLTVLAEKNLTDTKFFRVLFSQPIETSKSGLKRIALVTTVPQLSQTIKYLTTNKFAIEHIFDY